MTDTKRRYQTQIPKKVPDALEVEANKGELTTRVKMESRIEIRYILNNINGL